jgi:hypothetical protein
MKKYLSSEHKLTYCHLLGFVTAVFRCVHKIAKRDC